MTTTIDFGTTMTQLREDSRTVGLLLQELSGQQVDPLPSWTFTAYDAHGRVITRQRYWFADSAWNAAATWMDEDSGPADVAAAGCVIERTAGGAR